nr:efflux RND transporter periplasmic adaptor subunit [Chitinophagaceae bacterium]
MKKVFAFLLSVMALVSCKEKFESCSPSTASITESVYASGIIKSTNQYQVFSKANGIIASIPVKKGDPVKKGQVLFYISNENSLLNVDNAELVARNADFNANRDKLNELRLNINLARKKLKNDSLIYARQLNLWKEQIGTRIELEQRELAYSASRASYESAILRFNDLQKQLKFSSQQSQNNVSISKSMLSDYAVKSNLDGRVYTILKEKGEMATTQTPLAIIGDATQFGLLLQVDENDVVKIAVGQKVYVTLESYHKQIFEAVIDKINPLMNERSRTFEVEASFTKKPEVLYPNLTVEANIELTKKEKALIIPRVYLLDGDSVWISKKEKKKIITGLKDYKNVEVLEGLTEQDNIFKPIQ